MYGLPSTLTRKKNNLKGKNIHHRSRRHQIYFLRIKSFQEFAISGIYFVYTWIEDYFSPNKYLCFLMI